MTPTRFHRSRRVPGSYIQPSFLRYQQQVSASSRDTSFNLINAEALTGRPTDLRTATDRSTEVAQFRPCMHVISLIN
jgi:hypothetical protein